MPEQRRHTPICGTPRLDVRNPAFKTDYLKRHVEARRAGLRKHLEGLHPSKAVLVSGPEPNFAPVQDMALKAAVKHHLGSHAPNMTGLEGLVRTAAPAAARVSLPGPEHSVIDAGPRGVYNEPEQRQPPKQAWQGAPIIIQQLEIEGVTYVVSEPMTLPEAIVLSLTNDLECKHQDEARLLVYSCLNELESSRSTTATAGRQHKMKRYADSLLHAASSQQEVSVPEMAQRLLMRDEGTVPMRTTHLDMGCVVHRPDQPLGTMYGTSAGTHVDIHLYHGPDGWHGVVLPDRATPPIYSPGPWAVAGHLAGPPFCAPAAAAAQGVPASHPMDRTAAAAEAAPRQAAPPIAEAQGPFSKELMQWQNLPTAWRKAITAMLLLDQLGRTRAMGDGLQQHCYQGCGGFDSEADRIAAINLALATAYFLGDEVLLCPVVLDAEWYHNEPGEPKEIYSLALVCGFTGRVLKSWRVRHPGDADAQPAHPTGARLVDKVAIQRLLLQLHRQLRAQGVELVTIGWGPDNWDAILRDLPAELAELRQVAFVDISYAPQLLNEQMQPMSLDAAYEYFTGCPCDRDVQTFLRRHSAVVDSIYTARVLRGLVREDRALSEVVAVVAAEAGH